jgi:tetratricopeptide (TPR) repeat protein
VNPDTLKETTAPSLDVVAEIDAACDRFEAEWRAGGRPRIEAYLAAASERARGGLLAELLRVEIAHRAARGETLLTEDYTPRFPEHARLIDTLLACGQAAGPSHPAEAGRYRIEGFLAGGGMGLVYRAHDPDLRRPLAVKVLREEYKDEPPLVARFLEEARITGQLQHPGIPPVHEIGRLPDGRPFLAMKLLAGRTLADLLAAPRDAADGLARFLPVYEQVCQTLAYAHARGVIHRDLKPANIMVGAFGEVQVMDWGLAKSIRPAADKCDEPSPGGAGARALTPPQETLSGPTVPGAVMGTLAFMPPEQARGEVERLDERSDVFGLGAILCVLLTGQPPYRQRARAKLLEQAQSADLADAFTRLERCGADPDLVKLAMRCLAKEPAARPRNAAAVADVVAACQESVRERLRQAQLERAGAEVAAGEERKRRRLLLTASGIIALVLLAGLGASLWQMRRAVQAEAAASASAEQAGLSAEEAKSNAKQARNERDAKGAALAAAEQQARRDETKARQQAFAALRSITADVVERKFAQGAALTPDDRAFLRGVIAQFDAFAEIKGDDADSRAVRGEGRFRVGNIRSRLGELTDAEKDYDQALSIYKQLAADFPSRPAFRQQLAASHNNRGVLLHDTGRLQEAEKDFDQALSILKQLAADFPSRPAVRQDLGTSHRNRGDRLRDTGRLTAAKKEFDQALSIHKQPAADFPSGPEFRHELANSHNSRGGLLHRMGRLADAVKDYDQALSIRKQLANDFPSRPEFRQELAGSHNNRGILLHTMGRLADAEKDYAEALRIQRQLAADFPSRPEFRRDLANSHNSRAHVLYNTGRHKEAEKDFDQALSIYEQLAADFPSRPKFQRELAASHNNRGILLHTMGRLTYAEKDYDQALRIQKQLAADFPDQPDLRHELAGAYVNLALLHEQQGNWAAAKRLLLEGQAHHLAALKANTRQPTYRQFYRNHLSALTEVHAGLLEHEEAVRTAETRRDLGWNAPTDAYDAASFLSRCISIVAKHGKLDDKQRKQAAQYYGTAAMRLLRDAVSKGYRDVPRIKKDTALAPLRQRQDFQKLIAELEGKGK